MVIIGDSIYPPRQVPSQQATQAASLKVPSAPAPSDIPSGIPAPASSSTLGFSSHDVLMNHLKMANHDDHHPASSLDITNGDTSPMEESIEDMPLLVSDHEGYSDDESTYSGVSSRPKQPSHSPAALEAPTSSNSPTSSPVSHPAGPVPSVTAEQVRRSMKSTAITVVKSDGLSSQQFRHERSQLMTIIVKYIATKIQNSFPPESPRVLRPDELPLDKFLLLLTSRLRLSLPVFMKGIIYLFRYMDIIYLLRYLNQSNNFANYTDMGFELKKLIVGCFKLAIMREKRMAQGQSAAVGNLEFNWQRVAGLPNQEINTIVKKIVSRMNGKLNIKNIELVKLKSEIFRFVKMVATEV